MSFRRRNVAVTSKVTSGAPPSEPIQPRESLAGVRPSTIDGRSVTSTGTSALDGLLAGHGGLALGCSLLIEESGTTDYAGALLKFYAAEGLLQGHHVHVVGLPEQWGRELPGVVDEKGKDKAGIESEKMKIAWRYENLGLHGSTTGAREAPSIQPQAQATDTPSLTRQPPFNHSFDLTKRLVHPSSATLNFIPLSASASTSPFTSVLTKLTTTLNATSTNVVHRLIIPSLLSPLLYPPHLSHPHHILPFLHSLRHLLSRFNLTIILSLPLSLYPRSSGLTRWIEILSDGVLELAPFPHTSVAIPTPSPSTTTTAEEPPQGLLRIHKIPILHELGSGTRNYDDDWTFSLSRRKLNIKPFNLPPVEGDTQVQQEAVPSSTDVEGKEKSKKGKKEDLEF